MKDERIISINYMSTMVPFRGTFITLDRCDRGDCSHEEIDVVHHYDDEGRHYCPTGFVMCLECGGTGIEPEPHECNLWKMRP